MANTRMYHMRKERLAKLCKLRELGINPFPSKSTREQSISSALDQFDTKLDTSTTLGGRMMSLRTHGKVAFVDLVDESGQIQLFIRADELQPLDLSSQNLGFAELSLLDPGDIVEAHGVLMKTKTSEPSLLVKRLTLLTKSLRPLPNPHDALSDPELVFRKRYLDLMLRPEQRQLFARKSKFWRVQRQYLVDQGFIEVETPVLEHVTGGADARPFITHMNALDQEFYLRISTELYQKRLIGGGFEKIFTFGPNFRNEGLSDEHLTEYNQLEWYWAYASYLENMKLVSGLLLHVAKEVYGTTTFTTRGHTFDLSKEWQIIDYVEILHSTYGLDIFTATDQELAEAVKAKGINLPGTANRNRLIDNLWKAIRKTISGPAFLINEPAFMSPLAKSKAEDPRLTERFHVILAGSELGNGYSELNDPQEQFARFKEQQDARDAGDDEAQMMDLDFVEMLEYGMPPTSGYGQSERVFWFFEDISAREGTLFPALRRVDQSEALELLEAS